MKIADIIKSAWKNIRVHKGETIKNIVLLALSVSIITISCMFTEKVTDVTYNIREQAALHVMSASYIDEADMKSEYEKFVNDDRVYEIGEGPLKAYNGVCTNTDELFDVDYDVMFFLNRYLDYYSQYCTYKGTLNDDEIILPKYLSIAEGYMWSDYFDTGKFIDTSSLVGKTMTIEMDFPEFNGEKMCLKKDFKIVGILDNVKSLHPGTEIFMNGNAIKEFKDFWNAEEERVVGPGDEVEIVGEYYMVIKDVDDVEKILDEKTNFHPTAYLHKNEVDNIDYIMKAVEDAVSYTHLTLPTKA